MPKRKVNGSSFRTLRERVRSVEREAIAEALLVFGDNNSQIARALAVSRSHLIGLRKLYPLTTVDSRRASSYRAGDSKVEARLQRKRP